MHLTNWKEGIVVEKEYIKKINMENKEIMREKKHEYEQKGFHSMEVIYERTIAVNNDITLNDDEQEDELKHLK